MGTGCMFKLFCTGGGPGGIGWSRDVKADMADISTSSLTKMFPCTRVWISGEGGTVMYVEIWRLAGGGACWTAAGAADGV